MDEILTKIMEAAFKTLEERQKLPDQYIVVYRKKEGDEVLGFHASTGCQLVSDPLKAKRYQGKEPDKQLAVIWKNVCSMLKTTEEDSKVEGLAGFFKKISYSVKTEYFSGITEDDIYIDAVYLCDGTEPQKFSAVIIKPNNNG